MPVRRGVRFARPSGRALCLMKTELIDHSTTRKELKIEIEADAVRKVFDQISDRYAKLASVPGFRPGHAPRAVVRTRFKNEIRGEVLRELVPQAVQDAIIERHLNVIGEPDVHLDNTEGLGQMGTEPISVHVHVEVLPEVTLGEYKGLEGTRRVRPVTDEDVDRVIEGLREASAALQPVEDRGAAMGDTVTADFQGKFVNDTEAEDINVEDVDVVLGGDGVEQAFTDNLQGVEVDDERKFTVKYAEDFTSKGLAGKEVEYTARVTAVRRKELPEMDDEWARSLGEEFDSVSTLRERVQEDLRNRAGLDSENLLRSQVMHRLVEAHPFEVPESLLEHQTNQRLETLVREMMTRGVDPRSQEINWAGAREQMKSQADADVRGAMLLDRIAEAENIDVSDEEVEAEIESMAAASRQSVEQVRAALTKQGGATSIADRLRNRKALDLVIENARVTEEEWREETMLAESETAEAPEATTTAGASEAQTDQKPDEERAKAEGSSSEA
jgi:trigger factor